MSEWLTQGLKGISKLPERQVETLVLLSQGCSDQEIADALTIQPETAETFIKRVYRHLSLTGNQPNLKRVRAAVIFRAARERGIRVGASSGRRV